MAKAVTDCLSLCYCTPHKTGNSDNRSDDKEPPDEPEDADEYEYSNNNSKEGSYKSSHGAIVTMLQRDAIGYAP